MRSRHTLALLSLMLIIQAAGCSLAPQSIIPVPDRPLYKSFTLTITSGQKREIESIGKALWESVKDKLIQKGYIYKEAPGSDKEAAEHADLKAIISYKTILNNNQFLQLKVRLDIYDNLSSQKIWGTSASNTVQHRDIVADLIQPIARQITLRFPYAAHLGGVGVIIGRDLRIREFSPQSPAREAGLRANDKITKVDDKEVNELDECKNMLKGKVNTQVNLRVRRGERELTFVIKRISLNNMMKKAILIDEEKRKTLKEDFRKEVLGQR